MKVQILCATPEGNDSGVSRISTAFPGTLRKRCGVVPATILGGPTPLRDVVRRYEGAAPYTGPEPAHLWTLTLPVSDVDRDPQKMRDLTLSLCKQGLLLDLDVSVAWEPEPLEDFTQDALRGDPID